MNPNSPLEMESFAAPSSPRFKETDEEIQTKIQQKPVPFIPLSIQTRPWFVTCRRFYRKHLKPLPIRESHLAYKSPYQKFVKYRRWPCKIILNAIILALMLVNVFGMQVSRNEYEVENHQVFMRNFLPSDYDTETTTPYVYQFMNASDVISFMQQSTLNYFSLIADNPGMLGFPSNGSVSNGILKPTASVTYRTNSARQSIAQRHLIVKRITPGTTTFPLDLNNPTPLPSCGYPWIQGTTNHNGNGRCRPTHFDGEWYLPCRSGTDKFKTCFDSFDEVDSVVVRYEMVSMRHGVTTRWHITQTYDMSSHSMILPMSLFIGSTNSREGAMPEEIQRNTAMNISLLFLVILDIALRVRSGLRRHISWSVWAMLTHFVTIVFVFLQVLESSTDGEISLLYNKARALCMGLSTLMSLFLCVSYFHNAPSYYVLMKTMSRALPHLLLLLVGVVPIFMAYALCGVAVFGSYCPWFATLDQAIVTLFCVLNGDSIRDSFVALSQTDNYTMKFFSRIYLYSFVCVFIYNVLNVTLTIVQDTYIGIKETYGVYRHEEKTRKTIEAHTQALQRSFHKDSGDVGIGGDVSPSIQNSQHSLSRGRFASDHDNEDGDDDDDSCSSDDHEGQDGNTVTLTLKEWKIIVRALNMQSRKKRQ
eukprot:PhF_6_TR24844/c0_g1_i1/m.34271/K04994/MCOLN3; mucolipin 3